MRNSLRIYLAVICAVGVWSVSQVAAWQASSQGQATVQIKREPAVAINSIEGKDTYAAYCAVCHGRTGTGNGPAAPALKVAPADLTRLAARQGGEYNPVVVERMILGTGKTMPAHGDLDMPIWGPVFHSMTNSKGIEALRLHNLVSYLKSIQAK
jgi:cytochrome c553